MAVFARFFAGCNQAALVALLLGAMSVLGFAPFYFYPAPIVALAAWFYLLQQASNKATAAWLGFAFGLGLLLTGVSWIYVSLHDYGGMPSVMAGLAVLIFCAFLALFYAAVAWLSAYTQKVLIAAPIFLVLWEWIRSWIFTGFPWLNMGNSQIPYSPLAGLAPVFGIYGVSLMVALLASTLLLLCQAKSRKIGLVIFVGVWISCSLLKKIEWTHAVGKPLSVALLQGNIAQETKWDQAVVEATLRRYAQMANASQAQLIVMPETALPLLLEQVPDSYMQYLRNIALRNGGDMLFGVLESEQGQYFNSVVSTGVNPPQHYRKYHLVPFGEYIPLKSVFGWIYRDWLNMPISDLARGSKTPSPMQLAGQSVGVNICYEDVFGEEIIRQLPSATILVNASNMAWFGKSWSADQHLQMSQARALETGRTMLRATNTGATAVIDPHGQLLQKLPYFQTATLNAQVQGYAGQTPYVGWGNTPVLILLWLAVVGLLWQKYQSVLDLSGSKKEI